MLYNLQDAKSELASLLDLAEGGEEVIIARDGRPVVRLERIEVSGRRKLGLGRGSAPTPKPDAFRAMTDEEATTFLEGR
jgi:antitoxin (DNA-binding transcriptional repressor) of toxin-antitoxin stability system